MSAKGIVRLDAVMHPLTLPMSMVHTLPCHMAAKHQRTCLTLRVSPEVSSAHPMEIPILKCAG